MATVRRWTGREAKALRRALRLTQADFAAYLGMSERSVAGWDARGAEVTPSNTTQQTLDKALALAGPDVHERFELFLRGSTAEPVIEPARLTVPRQDDSDWEDPADLWGALSPAEPSPVHAEVFGELDSAIDRIVARYELDGPGRLAAPTARLRLRAHRMLSGSLRLGRRMRLYDIAAKLSGLLAYMAVNTGRFRLAEFYTREALTLAEETENTDLQVWLWGTRSFGAYYAGRYEDARDHAITGWSLAPGAAQSIRVLVNGEARARGKLGDRDGTDRAIGRALELLGAHDTPSALTPCLSFEPYGYPRIAANAATAYVPLGGSEQVLAYTAHIEHTVERSESDWSRALVNLDVAMALLHDKQPDPVRAMTKGREALAYCFEHPVLSVWQRAHELSAYAAQWAGEPAVEEFDEALREWRELPATQIVRGRTGGESSSWPHDSPRAGARALHVPSTVDDPSAGIPPRTGRIGGSRSR